jgi:O-antigen/teichoic acid export membrane protein
MAVRDHPIGQDPDKLAGRPEDYIRTLAAGTGLIFLGFALYAILNLAFQLLVARTLGPEDVGRYFEAAAVVGIILGLCTGGLTTGLVRFVALLDRSDAAFLARRIILGDVGVASLVGIGLVTMAPLLADRLFHDPQVTTLLRIGAIGLPLGALGLLLASNARGRGAFRYHFLAEQISLPVARLLVAAVVLPMGVGVVGAITALVAGFTASAIVGLLGARRIDTRVSVRDRVSKPGLVMRMLRFSAYRWGVDALGTVLLWADIVILGALRGPTSTGTYAVATRIILFTWVGLVAVNLALAPAAARQLEARRAEDAARLFAVAARWGAVLTLIPLAIVLALRVSLLELLGDHFVSGAETMIILAIGIGFSALCGPLGTMIDMSTHNRLFLWNSIGAVATNVALNFALIPVWGINGAATAWTISLILVNLLLLYQTKRYLGVAVLLPLQVRTALAVTAVGIIVVVAAGAVPVLSVVAAAIGFPVTVVLTRAPEEGPWVRSILGALTRRPKAGRAGRSIEG